MPLWDDLADALGAQAVDLADALGDRVVEDSLNGDVRIVLLCESPSGNEISHGHPLAGTSGKEVTRAFAHYRLVSFVGQEEPIGCMLHSPPEDDGMLNSLGLMNVSNLPLSSSAYCHEARANYSELLCYFEAIRSGRQHIRSLDDDHDPSLVYAALRDDFTSRLRQLQELPQSVEIIPCGRVANAFFDWAIGNDHDLGAMSAGFSVPHPSPNGRGGWRQRGSYRDCIRVLVETIQHALN